MFNALQNPTESPRRSPPPASESETASSGVPAFLREAESAPEASEATSEAAAASGTASACSTEAEEQEKERFRQRTFSALRFRPSAGYGIFDAYYWPRSSLMAAIVKMKFNFVQAEDTPSIWELIRMRSAGEDISVYFWTEAQKREYSRGYETEVSRRWSFEHTFRSTKPCWDFSADPYIAPRVVEDSSDAHYNVTVYKMSGATSRRISSFSARNPGTDDWQGTGELDEYDLNSGAGMFSLQVARTERQRLQRAVRDTLSSPVLFEQNRAIIRGPYLTRLQNLADAMNQKLPSAPGIPMILRGYASAEGTATRNAQLAQERVEAVADALNARGVPQLLIQIPVGPIGAPNDSANRKVDITVDTSFEGTYSGNDFSASAHEFGHAIGLPDEYANYTGTGNLADKQRAFQQLAQDAGVSPPDRWGDDTTSIMSVGTDVMPRHYLTVWEALGHMTSPHITRDQWSIG